MHLKKLHVKVSKTHNLAPVQIRVSGLCYLNVLNVHVSNPFLNQGNAFFLNGQTVICPYKDCNYTTNVYSSFKSHKSTTHHLCLCETRRAEGVESTLTLCFLCFILLPRPALFCPIIKQHLHIFGRKLQCGKEPHQTKEDTINFF